MAQVVPRTRGDSSDEVTEAWLRLKYETEMMSTYAIGAIVKRDPKTVYAWLKHYGIQTRKRGDNAKRNPPPANWSFRGRKHTDENKNKVRQRRLADGHVPYLKNGVHWLKGKRGADTPNWKGGLTPERQLFYSTPEWRAACVAVWRRANAKCERCGLDHRTLERWQRGSFNVHHIVSFMVRELRAEVSNLALLCYECHKFVHSRDNVAREFLK